MPWRADLDNDISIATSLTTQAARTTSANGTGVDLSGFRAAAVFFMVGAITDGTHTPKLQESDDNSSFSDVAAADQDGTLAALTANTNQKVSYKGRKRYIRAVVTVTGSPSTGGFYTATVIRGGARSLPQ